MRVVVVGASGNVGVCVLRALPGVGVQEVVGVSRRRPTAQLPGTEGVSWQTADVGSPDAAALLRRLFDGADAVVHLAWLLQPSWDPVRLERTNVVGSRQVFAAVAAAGVPALVYASSVGAYAPGPKHQPVDERWPATGVPSSMYSRQKATVEYQLDALSAEYPRLRVVRLRTALVFQQSAASEICRFFIGPPTLARLAVQLLPVLPRHPRLVFQAVHAEDVGRAYALAVAGDLQGPVNVAAEPVLDMRQLARLLGARTLPVPPGLLRAGAAVSWRMHLQPTEPGWVDLALAAPVMDTTRARTELGWHPQRSAEEAVGELLDGIRRGSGAATPPLVPSRPRSCG